MASVLAYCHPSAAALPLAWDPHRVDRCCPATCVCDHDAQRPHRTAAHGAARAPPRPPRSLGARLGQGTRSQQATRRAWRGTSHGRGAPADTRGGCPPAGTPAARTRPRALRAIARRLLNTVAAHPTDPDTGAPKACVRLRHQDLRLAPDRAGQPPREPSRRHRAAQGSTSRRPAAGGCGEAAAVQA